MSDGLEITLNPITGRSDNETTITLFEATSISGGLTGFTGYGTSPSEAVTSMYRKMHDDNTAH
jgi:hypothetical protein